MNGSPARKTTIRRDRRAATSTTTASDAGDLNGSTFSFSRPVSRRDRTSRPRHTTTHATAARNTTPGANHSESTRKLNRIQTTEKYVSGTTHSHQGHQRKRPHTPGGDILPTDRPHPTPATHAAPRRPRTPTRQPSDQHRDEGTGRPRPRSQTRRPSPRTPLAHPHAGTTRTREDYFALK